MRDRDFFFLSIPVFILPLIFTSMDGPQAYLLGSLWLILAVGYIALLISDIRRGKIR